MGRPWLLAAAVCCLAALGHTAEGQGLQDRLSEVKDVRTRRAHRASRCNPGETTFVSCLALTGAPAVLHRT